MNMVRETARESMRNSAVINYSGRSMAMAECKQLCKEIITSNQIDEIRFCDCLLSEDIAKCIINAIIFNTSIKIADFKGNNFRVKCSEYLCKLLKQTTTLKELYLEWNALGLYDTSMSAIAEGLAINKSIHVLDLSNNQICHNGGRLLSLALKRNKTLKSLDMRWNNIGVAGGREFLSALQHNKTLVNLQLAGNNIPSDTLKAIATSIQRNMDYHSMYQQHVSMTQSLKDEIDNIKHEKTLELTNLADELEKEKELHESFNQTTQNRLEELNKSLNHVSKEKDGIIQTNLQLETDLRSANMKIKYLEESMTDLSKCNSDLRKTHSEVLKTFEESMNKERKQWQSDISDRYAEISDLQKDVKVLQGQIDAYSAEISNLKNVVRSKEDDIIAMEHKHQREKEMTQRENVEQVNALTDRNARHSKDKNEMEEEITRLKSTLVNYKLTHEEELVCQRTNLKQEESVKVQKYEERITSLVTSKDELQASISRMIVQETDTRAKLTGYQKDIENYKQLVIQHQETGNNRDQEHRNEINKLHSNIDNEKRENRNLRSKLEAAEKNCTELKSEIEQQRSSRNSEISAKESEISSLKDTIKHKEDEIRRTHQDELNRTSMLESALQTYIISARQSKH